MNIVRENLEDGTTLLKATVAEADYNEAVDKALRTYKRKANVPGFRPGMVPMSIINKMYRKGVVAEEAYRTASKACFDYIETEKLTTVGDMIPSQKQQPLDFDNAFMYGVGHGGIEAMILIGISMLSNIVSSVMINSGAMAASLAALDADTAAKTAASLSALWQTPSAYFFLSGLERVIAITLHISLSLLVFRAVRYGEKKYLLLAYFLHFLVDAASVLINAYLPLWTVEIVSAALTVLTMYLAKRACKNENAPITEET